MSGHDKDGCGYAQPAPEPKFTLPITLSGAAIDTFRCLFLHGPTWDGDIPSKQGRGELFDLKLASRVEGWSFLTADGMRLALKNGLDRDKQSWERKRRRSLNEHAQIKELFVPSPVETGMTVATPTAESLQAILDRPEA